MGRGTLPIEKHPTHFKIILSLYNKCDSSYGIAKKLEKSQSNIYDQMRKMEAQDYILADVDNSKLFCLNKKKIKMLYLERIYKHRADTKKLDNLIGFGNKAEKSKFPAIDTIYSNAIFDEIFDMFFNELNSFIMRIDENLSLDSAFLALNRIFSNSRNFIPHTSRKFNDIILFSSYVGLLISKVDIVEYLILDKISEKYKN